MQAIRVSRLRVPEGTPEANADMADRAFERLVDVMEGRVRPLEAHSILKASTRIREEICGVLAQKLDVQGSVSIRVVDPYAKPPESLPPESPRDGGDE